MNILKEKTHGSRAIPVRVGGRLARRIPLVSVVALLARHVAREHLTLPRCNCLMHVRSRRLSLLCLCRLQPRGAQHAGSGIPACELVLCCWLAPILVGHTRGTCLGWVCGLHCTARLLECCAEGRRGIVRPRLADAVAALYPRCLKVVLREALHLLLLLLLCTTAPRLLGVRLLWYVAASGKLCAGVAYRGRR